MRALIRNSEVMTEDTWSEWVRNNIPFLTGTEVDSEGQPMKGDGWVLVTDYNPELTPDENVGLEDEPYIRGTIDRSDEDDEPADDDVCTRIAEMPSSAPSSVEPEETVTIGGRTYTLSELKTLLH